MAVTVQMPPLHDAQREAMIASDGKRFVVMVCGRRWGKTSYAVLQILAHALQGELCWWVAPTLAQSRTTYSDASQVAEREAWRRSPTASVTW